MKKACFEYASAAKDDNIGKQNFGQKEDER